MGFQNILGGLSDVFGALAPVGGALAGHFLGKSPEAASLGMNLGNALGGIVSHAAGRSPSQQQPQQQPQQPGSYPTASAAMGQIGQNAQNQMGPSLGQFGQVPMGRMGQAMGNYGGRMMNQQMQQYLPQQIGRSNLGNIGQNAGSYFGQMAENHLPPQFQGMMSGIGQMGGQLMDRYMSPYTSQVPFRGPINRFGSQIGNYMGGRFDQQAQRRMPSQLTQSPMNQFGGALGRYGGSQLDQMASRGGYPAGGSFSPQQGQEYDEGLQQMPFAGAEGFAHGGYVDPRHHYGTGGSVLGGLLGPLLGPIGAIAGPMLGNLLPFAEGGPVSGLSSLYAH